MDQKQFSFRRYKDSDSEELYLEYVRYALANIQPFFSGPSVVPDKKKFIEGMRDYCNKKYRPPLVVDENDTVFGVYHLTYHRANGYFEMLLYLWRNKHLTEDVLKAIIEQLLHEKRPKDSLLLEVPEYEPELLCAANKLGLSCVGTIPKYLRHEMEDAHAGVLYDKHFYWVSSELWHNEHQK